MRTGTFSLAVTTGISALAILVSLSPKCAADDLHSVKGIQAFHGSGEARALLKQNGFVVADPAFRQIFEAYIQSPETDAPSETNRTGSSLPSFITADSAWDTYHVLLEEGVKQMEEIQAKRLVSFSRQLLEAAEKQNADPSLKTFAAVGLALQDKHYHQTLGGEAKRIVDGLQNGSTPVAVPMGFDLAPAQFRAQSFYAQSPELSDYFAARQWYASVVFRLLNPKETRLAVMEAELVGGDPGLLERWKQLSDPYDDFLAPAEDGSVPAYFAAATAMTGTNRTGASLTDSQIAAITKELEKRLPLPRVNDQLLSPEEYREFGGQTRGFRLLPPRRLPCAVCFQNTVDPKLRGRMYPSGLDFMAASPVLRSPAAIRALQSQFGKPVSEQILKTDCGPLPDSLHGEAMQLLALLQQPLPAQAPACMRSEAWSDLQLWTQLGAWAQQRHTWALHTKISIDYLGLISPPTGMVAPYPEFFAGLTKLTRQTALAFARAQGQSAFDAKTTASNLLQALDFSERILKTASEEAVEQNSDPLQQLGEFHQRYYKKHAAELAANSSRDKYREMEEQLRQLANDCAATGNAGPEQLETLRMYYDCRQDISQLLNNFAVVCDRLAGLATKSLKGQPLTQADAEWIENYGVTLAGFHFYYGNSYEVPRDDFPIVTRIFANPRTGSVFYAGLARPQSLYVIVPHGKEQQLYRGAVMTYREFHRPDAELLDDESWRQLVQKGEVPEAPPFTRGFLAQKSAHDWLTQLRAGKGRKINYDDREEMFAGLAATATDADLPELIQLMADSNDADEDFTTGIGLVIGKLNWNRHQRQIIQLLASPDTTLSEAAAQILIGKPGLLNVNALLPEPRESSREQRLRLVLLGKVPTQTAASSNALCQAAARSGAGIRWQALIAMGQAHWPGQPPIELLLERLQDTNQYVAAAAAISMSRLRLTNAAPALMKRLEIALQSPQPGLEEQKAQSQLITRDWEPNYRPVGGGHGGASILAPVNWSWWLKFNDNSDGNIPEQSVRHPPVQYDLSPRTCDLTATLIDAVGNLGYAPAVDPLLKLRGTDYDSEAMRALEALVPERLAGILLATALDKQTDSYVREQSLFALGNLSITNHVKELIPLLADTTPIVYSRPMSRAPWRICDRAAVTIAIQLGWEDKHSPSLYLLYLDSQRRGELMTKVSAWAKQAR